MIPLQVFISLRIWGFACLCCSRQAYVREGKKKTDAVDSYVEKAGFWHDSYGGEATCSGQHRA